MKSLADMTKSPAALLEQMSRRPGRVDAPLPVLFETGALIEDCPQCGGLGVHGYNVPLGHALFGKSAACRYPRCKASYERYQNIIAKRFGISGLPPDFFTDEKYRVCTFAGWERLSSDLIKGKKAAYSAARQIAEGSGEPFTLQEAMAFDWRDAPTVPNDNPRQGAVFTGAVGVGKTSLAMATAARLVDLAIPVLYIRVDALLYEIQRTYDPDSEMTTNAVLRIAEEVPVLILDEFNLQSYKPDRLEKLESIIRMRDAYHLRTMATTNLSVDAFYEKWGDRIADIMAKAHWIEMGGAKLRDTVSVSYGGF